MIAVCVDGSRTLLGDLNPSWLIEQISRRRADNLPVCIRIDIRCGDVNATLATSGCAGGRGGCRRPNQAEQRVFDLWNHHQLGDHNFAPGQMIAFLKKVESLCR